MGTGFRRGEVIVRIPLHLQTLYKQNIQLTPKTQQNVLGLETSDQHLFEYREERAKNSDVVNGLGKLGRRVNYDKIPAV